MGRRPESAEGSSRRRYRPGPTGGFQLTSAVLPVPDSSWEPCQAWRIESYHDQESDSEIPTLAAAVSEEILFEVYLALLDKLGAIVDVVLESHHASPSDGSLEYLREHIDLPVFKSYLLQFKELALEDGCLGIVVIDPVGPCEIQFDDHKVFVIYARNLEPFVEVFQRFQIERDDGLSLISEQEHVHSTFPHHAENLEAFRSLLAAELTFPESGR